MIPKNPKVGDVFTDEFEFRVIKVREDGTFISERITKANVKKDDFTEVKDSVNTGVTEEKTVTEPDVNFTKTQINRMPNAELEKVCKQLGIKVGTGTEMKRAIINKLEL